jgi:NADPH-dependent glutamate synthase beta subunit-like oxidoreductase
MQVTSGRYSGIVNMNSQEIQAMVEACMEEAPAPCTNACPLHLDIKEFVKRIKKGNFNGAYTLLRNHVLFPEIVCRLCHKPCEDECIRKTVDDPLSINALERSCIQYASDKNPIAFNLPNQDKKIVIFGAGLAGLSCALKLASKKYSITVFEKTDKIGGRLIHLMEETVYTHEIALQFQNTEKSLCLRSMVTDLADVDFDAAFIATGAGGDTFGLDAPHKKSSLKTNQKGVFMGGGIIGAFPIESIEHGILAANMIESYLKTGSMEIGVKNDKGKESSFKPTMYHINASYRVQASAEGAYTRDNAMAEAGRCVECQCDACKSSCYLLTYFNKYPKKIASDVIGTIYPATGMTARVATRLLNMCNMCGSCEKACPLHISVENILLTGRRALHKGNVMPKAFHEFWIRDMLHSYGEKSYLVSHAPYRHKSKYLFYPGCQLGASDPYYVIRSYEYLLSNLPDTGLLLGCCGAPAEWAGDEELHRRVVEDIRSNWLKMNKPKFITACPTCKKLFGKYIPEIETLSLYNVILENGIPDCHATREGKQSIFDPCSGRYDPVMRGDVRDIVKKMGIETEELKHECEEFQCCGYGGNIYAANPDYAIRIAKNRTEQSANPYITYCTNCRDVFSFTGKEAWHILDILFNLQNEKRKPPSLMQRRINREYLKTYLSASVRKGGPPDENFRTKTEIAEMANGNYSDDPPENVSVKISDELMSKMNKLLILEEDVKRTIFHCESTGEKLLETQSSANIGHLKIGSITYWVVYKKEGVEHVLLNVYSHRMSFES